MSDFDASMSVDQLKMYAQDISEVYKQEKQKRKDLEISNLKLRSLLDTVNIGIVSLDPHLNIIDVNNEFSEIINQPPENIRGMPLLTLLTGEVWENIFEGLKSKDEPPVELVNVNGDGSFFLNVSRVRLLNSTQQLIGWTFLFRDETKLRRSNLLKEEFFAISSHEIRTPVSIITGYIQLIRSMLGEKLEEKDRGFIDAIITAGDRLARTTSEMLDISNQMLDQPKFEMQILDFDKIVADVADGFELVFRPKDVTVNYHVKPGKFQVYGDENALSHAVRHLVENAVEFSEVGSSVEVLLEPHDGNCKLSITDEGEGIPKQEMDMIFEPNYQVDEHMTRGHEGIGLGLTIVKRTARLHGGSIKLDSTLGKGTQAVLQIPFYDPNRHDMDLPEITTKLDLAKQEATSLRGQLNTYAKDINALYLQEKGKRKELVDKNQQLKIYAKELNTTVRDLNRTQGQLQDAYLDTIYRLALIAEHKDEDTAEHIIRMSSYSAFIAEEMGLDKELVQNIKYAAPMHDLGKVGIPDNILTKPAKLTEEEFKVMMEHPVLGQRVFRDTNSDVLKLAEEIAGSHHEKWDGSGYPRGLAGDLIPLSGRIVAVADVFDALVSKRPYKKAFPLEEALTIIRNGSGQHFDPEVIAAFERCLPKILEKRAEIDGAPTTE